MTQDPIGLTGGWGPYTYTLDPLENVDPFGLYQMCHRTLQANLPYARHCYIKFEDGNTSSYDPNGVNPDPQPNKEGTICTGQKDVAKDLCIAEAMKKCKGENYNFTKFNCCHCAEQAMKECDTSIPQDKWPNFPINPGPQPGEPGYTDSPVYNSGLGK